MLLRAIILIQKWTFRGVFPKFSSNKMILCNDNDQTWFSDTLTNVRPLGSHVNPRLSGSGLNTTLGGPADVNAEKNMFDPYIDPCLIIAIITSSTSR